ncbi:MULTISPECIES: hypothetical protein [Bacillus]|uniref:hypothetical protein n=1 Tax=Bacillus TaxID=1386 RepID=UPI000624FF98|nr:MULTISPECIES: hypothetical protein [Bacillus]KKK10306.1 hypothetical protein UF15_07345 [Bacillus sp. L_1B0_12]WHF27679.1 hypothetical protein QJS65_03240 [Bacillus altitudinis]SFX69729.1 hypothetical protein SAMN04487921_10946 [Bacillus altitudinis]SNS25474.1 hypothetical protein SAMN05880584_10948 [Bacillus altitudinis]
MTEFITDILTVIVSFINLVFVYFVYKLTKKDVNPKLYIIPVLKDAEGRFDKNVIHELVTMNFNQQGFPKIIHNNQLWQLKICNNGELPATNVVIEYSITIKKAEFDFGLDKADVINERFVDFKTISKTIKFDYLPPNFEKVVDVLYLDGKFPYADLKINKMTSNELIFINDTILMDTYEHPEFQKIEDSHHYRQMLGANI